MKQIQRRVRPHLSYVDGLRALCALWVVGGHGWGEVGLLSPIQTIFARILNYAHFGVTTFIVISGFCLAIPVVQNGGQLKGGSWKFFKKRARRILPPYYLALILSLGLVYTLIGTPGHTHWDVSLPVDKRMIAEHILLIHNFFHPAAINHAMWSIAVEWQIYFLFPGLVWVLFRLNPKTTLVILFLISIGIEGYLTLRTDLWAVPVHYVWLFALGMFAAQISFTPVALPEQKFFFLTSVASGASLVVTLCFTDVFSHPHYLPILDIMAGLTASGLIAGMATGVLVRTRRILEWRPLVWIGIFSYSLYLIHAPLLAVAERYFIKPLHVSPGTQICLMVLVVSPVVVLLAFFFFWICEKPFMTPALRKNVIGEEDRVISHALPAVIRPMEK